MLSRFPSEAQNTMDSPSSSSMVELVVDGRLNGIKLKAVVDVHNRTVGSNDPVLRVGGRGECGELLIKVIDISIGIEENGKGEVELINECLDRAGVFL